jgi:riboflavin kinase/FMN adenylyltransferase
MVRLHWMTPPPAALTRGAVTVGNFDGVHRGHESLVAAARRWAREVGGPAVAVTFDPPAAALLFPGPARPPLTTLGDRVELLRAAGADHVAVLATDAGLLSLTPEAFFEDVLVRAFAARAVVEGYNFRFGKDRAGDTAALRGLCAGAGVAFEEVPPVLVGGAAVSSSRVRAALDRGDVGEVRQLLGRPYGVAGEVVTGAQRGRTLGFPTANLGPSGTLLPADGVYAVRATLDGVEYAGAANVGPAPTFGETARKVEVHLLDFTGDLYGRRLAVHFLARIRGTMKFASAGELVTQLAADSAAARAATRELS